MAVLNVIGYQQLTVSTVAVGLTMPTVSGGPSPTRPKRALILCGPLNAAATAYVRWRADGTDPTASVGMPLAVGDYLDLTLGEDFSSVIQSIKFIRAAADVTLEITYFG